MSTVLLGACWPLQDMTPAQKAVLISLADNANDEGYCWPAVNTIAIRTCLSERAVRDALRWLEAAGAVETSERRGGSSLYRVTPQHYGGPRQEILPGITPAASAPRQHLPPGEKCRPPRQHLPPTPAASAPKPSENHQGTVKQEGAGDKRPKLSVSPAEMVASIDGLSLDVATEFAGYRKSKRAALTPLAWRALVKEIGRSGWNPDDALTEVMARGWQSLKAEWINKEVTHAQGQRHAGGLSPADRVRIANEQRAGGRTFDA